MHVQSWEAVLEEEGKEEDADPSTSSHGSWMMGGGSSSQRSLRGRSQKSFRDNGALLGPPW